MTGFSIAASCSLSKSGGIEAYNSSTGYRHFSIACVPSVPSQH